MYQKGIFYLFFFEIIEYYKSYNGESKRREYLGDTKK